MNFSDKFSSEEEATFIWGIHDFNDLIAAHGVHACVDALNDNSRRELHNYFKKIYAPKEENIQDAYEQTDMFYSMDER